MQRRLNRHREFAVASAVSLLVAALAAVPLAWNRIFYYSNDNASRFLPTWYDLGTQLLHGHWPAAMDPGMWSGGNLAAESVFGLYNPLNELNYMLVAALPDLAVAAALVAAEYLALLALGVYVLCREYGAVRWASAAVAVAVPFAGFTLYFDAGIWLSNLIAFAYFPHVWWSLRRAARGKMNPLWAFIIGSLDVLTGTPYGILAICIVVVALLGEFGATRCMSAVRRTLLVAVFVAAIVPLVYLPLIGSAAVSWRADSGVSNSGFLVAGLGAVFHMSLPTYLPRIRTWGGHVMSTPTVYFAWFALPLLPWLSWRRLQKQWRPLAGALVVAAVYLLLTVAPSNFWMFRLMLRVITYLYLALGVLLAAVLSAGLRYDRFSLRVAATALILLVGTYLAVANQPERMGLALASLALTAILCAAAVAAAFRHSGRALGAILCAGTVLVVSFQTYVIPANNDVGAWRFPHSVQELRGRFADRYRGTTIEIASAKVAARNEGLYPGGAYQDLLFGNAFLPAGVEAVNSYAAMGFARFADTFCMSFRGDTRCPEAYRALWRTAGARGVALADLMKVDTVVVQKALVPGPTVPGGWHVAEQDGIATVLRRDQPLPWPHGRLSWVSSAVTVRSDTATAVRETVRFAIDRPGERRMVFARLNWPGYQASVNGRPVTVSTGRSGLLIVHVPADVSGGTLQLQWSPPGRRPGTAAAIAGSLGALAFGVREWRRRRGVSGSSVQ